MYSRTVLFVFRKPNKGNFSIEKVYNTVLEVLQKRKDSIFTFRKVTLQKNYDIARFLSNLFTNLFSRKIIAHVTGGCNYMVMAFPFSVTVLTIHDMYHYKTKGGLKGTLYDWFFYNLPVTFANAIVVVSEQTREEVQHYFPKAKAKIFVIHNPMVIPDSAIVYRERSFKLDEALQILQIGDKPLKNYGRLLEATKDKNVHYHFVHADDGARVRPLLKKYGLAESATIYSDLVDEAFFKLYKKCDVLYFASEAEGFGLPIIEAQAFGMPVITSNLAPMNTVGIGAILVDPFNVESIKDGFEKLYEPNIMKVLYEDSNSNYKRFSKKTIAAQYLNLYEALL